MMKKTFTNVLWSSLVLFSLQTVLAGQEEDVIRNLEEYQVIWNSPSKDCSGSMPIGNGDIGLNVWMEENGDLSFYIGKTDSWGDNGRLLKVGKVRVSFTPTPLVQGDSFRQTLALENGEIVIEIAEESGDITGLSKTVLRIWVDANHPVIHVSAKSHKPFTATAQIELWRNEPYELPSIEVSDVHLDRSKPDQKHAPTIVEPDTILKNQPDRIGWYHHNKKSVGPELTMRIQGLSDYKIVDPLLHRTFGGIIKSKNGRRVDDLTLTTTKGTEQRFDICVLTVHPSSPAQWLEAMNTKINEVENVPFEQRRQEHLRWWQNFWNRSWIVAKSNSQAEATSIKPAEQSAAVEDDAFIVSRAYTLQRFIDACAGRGVYPIKFNGSIFTVPNAGSPGDADYRLWGPGYWWQNTRLPYISMCMSGDFDLMRPLFRMYGEDIFELSKYRTRHYFGHEGVYFPECMYFWGAVFSDTYGWEPFDERKDKLQTSGWHKWEWVSGPELVCLMLDYYEYTEDESFLRDRILPVAKEVMLFFEKYYQTGPDGKLVMHPSQAVETWWECTNPMPEVAGLRAMTHRVLELPERLITDKERTYWQSANKKLPDIPTREEEGVRMLAPAEKFAQKINIENPELYAVYPFRQIAIGKPNIELGIEALKHRWDKGNFGWRQDDIFMAYLGLTDQARDYLVGRAKNKHKGSRFPAFWGPNYDWVPDQDHGSVLMKAFQSMLMQTDGRKIYLLPAWPRDWDADFKLHAPYKTIIQGQVRNGEVKELEVTPKARLSDIEVTRGATQ